MPQDAVANFAELHQKMTVVEASMQLFARQMQQLEVAVGVIQSQGEAQRLELKDQVQLAFVQEKHEINDVVNQAQQEFTKPVSYTHLTLPTKRIV